jgi:threonine synthase
MKEGVWEYQDLLIHNQNHLDMKEGVWEYQDLLIHNQNHLDMKEGVWEYQDPQKQKEAGTKTARKIKLLLKLF